MSETCLKCGAIMREEAFGIILNHITDGRICMDRQIAALKTEIAALLKEGRELNEEMKSWRTYFKERLDAWRNAEDMGELIWEFYGAEYNKLKDLGEL